VIAIKYAKITKQGNRDINEDAAAIARHEGDFCFVVADGLGGHGRGEEASQTAVAEFEREFSHSGPDAAGFLARAFGAAQNAVMERQKTEHARFEMMTTAVALAIVDGKCAWGHIGDSRLYAFKRNKVKTRTLDHSVTQMLALSGDIREKQMRGHPDRNKLLRVIGIKWDSPMFAISDESDLSKYQAFLLCSDGFWELVDEKYMCASLKKARSADEWLGSMTAEAEKNGIGQEMDNYTAIAVIL